jgi:hypothetical protein
LLISFKHNNGIQNGLIIMPHIPYGHYNNIYK